MMRLEELFYFGYNKAKSVNGGGTMKFRPCIDIHNGKVKQIINYFHTTSSAYPVPIYEVNGKRYSKTAFFKVYNKYMNNAKLLF